MYWKCSADLQEVELWENIVKYIFALQSEMFYIL